MKNEIRKLSDFTRESAICHLPLFVMASAVSGTQVVCSRLVLDANQGIPFIREA